MYSISAENHSRNYSIVPQEGAWYRLETFGFRIDFNLLNILIPQSVFPRSCTGEWFWCLQVQKNEKKKWADDFVTSQTLSMSALEKLVGQLELDLQDAKNLNIQLGEQILFYKLLH